jgi:PAS domain S-box-containing protein
MPEEANTAELDKILVVDDASANLQLLTDLLTEQGYAVYPASDGELALEFTQSVLPDLILLDIKLPGMDGYEICRRLKADEKTRAVPIIFLSVLEEADAKVKGFRAGAVDYITKPFQVEEVLSRVQTHLRLQRLTNRLHLEVRSRTQALAASNERLHRELAERRKTEAHLRESEKKFRGLVQTMQTAVVVHAADTRILTSNRKAQRLLGLTEAQMMGKQAIDPAWHFFREDGRVMPLEAYPVNRVLATGRPLRDLVVGVRRPRTRDDVWVLANADPVMDEQGHVIQVIVTFVDITARRKAQADLQRLNRQLHANEQLFRALVENSPDFIARYDRAFRRVYVNPAVQELFGRQAQELIGQTPADQSPLETPQAYIGHLQNVIETGIETSAEIPFRTATGEMHWGQIRFVPEFGPQGQVDTVLAIGRDVHEIKENEQRFRMLAENFPDFVVRYDRHGRHTYVNPAVAKAFGLPADAIVGKTLHELPLRSKPEQNHELEALIQRVYDEGDANRSEARWDTEAGERIFEVRHEPEKDASGNVVSVLGIARDITEREQMEQERAATLRFFESMDKINRAIQSSIGLQQMMEAVLAEVLADFDCDRAFLLYPCDPEAETWKTYMEKTKPDYPGALALEIELPVGRAVAETFRVLAASEGPVTFGPGNQYPIPRDYLVQFGFQSKLLVTLHPIDSKPWVFGLHQCAYARVWTKEEERLFQEIGRRLENALTSMLMQRHLRESERRYRMVFENSPVPCWEEDFSAVKALLEKLKKDGTSDIETYFDGHPETVAQCARLVRIVDVNRAALDLHGAADKAELMAGLAQTFTPASLATFRRELVCLWHGGTRMIADAVVKTLAGEPRQVSVYFSVVPGYEETLSKIIVSLVDITERKRNEAVNLSRWQLIQFAESHSLKELLEETLNHVENLTGSHIGFYHFVDGDQKMLRLQNWSVRTKSDLCTADGEVLHYPISEAGVWVDCVHQRKPVVHNDYAALPHRKGMPDGHPEVVRQLIVPVIRGDKIVAILGTGNKPSDYTDADVQVVSLLADHAWEIAERKRVEEKIQQLNQELEQRVRDRTAQLEATNKELNAFAYTVSHDLRAPLRHIDGFLELLQTRLASILDKEGRHYMGAIAEAALKMGVLIDELLAFSRMSRQGLAVQPVALGPLVREVIQDLEPDITGRSIDWRIDNLPTVRGDAAMLRMVLVNLTANAIKFTRQQEQARIEIGAVPHQENGDTVIYVRDNGVGFDMAYGEKLFGVFQRLHRTDEFEGTGIGLASTRRIIERHGGRTWAESSVGQGATFYFSLPPGKRGSGDVSV